MIFWIAKATRQHESLRPFLSRSPDLDFRIDSTLGNCSPTHKCVSIQFVDKLVIAYVIRKRGVVRRPERTEFHRWLLLPFFHTSLSPRLLFSKSPALSCVMKGKTESGGRLGFLFFSASCHVKLIIRPVKCPEIGVFFWCISSVCLSASFVDMWWYVHDCCIVHKIFDTAQMLLGFGFAGHVAGSSSAYFKLFVNVLAKATCIVIAHFVT